MPWQHLTLSGREVLAQMTCKGEHPQDMAARVGCHRSTIYREWRRNGRDGDYFAARAPPVAFYPRFVEGKEGGGVLADQDVSLRGDLRGEIDFVDGRPVRNHSRTFPLPRTQVMRITSQYSPKLAVF